METHTPPSRHTHQELDRLPGAPGDWRRGGSRCSARDAATGRSPSPGRHRRTCRVALLAPGRRRWTQFGDILFNLDSPGATRLTPFTSAKAKMIGAARTALENRYDLIEHFSRRQDRLKEVGRVVQRAAAAPLTPVSVSGLGKAGRNDPCPCGSGKEYIAMLPQRGQLIDGPVARVELRRTLTTARSSERTRTCGMAHRSRC